MHLWEIEQRAHAIFNGVFVGTINRVGQEAEYGPNDYYGSSYFCDPRGQYVADLTTGKGQAGDAQEQMVVCDLDFDKVREVRNTWQFYRDRRPEMYGDIANPMA
jgi:N-carbamoylputrescine amidase